MARLNVRYEGQTVALDDGFNFNPQSFGTARLNVRVNSTSTLKFGLTTNTNAKDYCKLAVRVGGQTAYIGRVSTTKYSVGETVDYKDSVSTSRSETVLTEQLTRNPGSGNAAESPTNPGTAEASNQTGYTKTTYVKTNTYPKTSANGNGSATSAADPTIRTVTNSTGSTVTTRTVSENVQSRTETWYSFYRYNFIATISLSSTRGITFPALGKNVVLSTSWTGRITSDISYTYYTFKNTSYNSLYSIWTARTTSSNTVSYIKDNTSATVSTTRTVATSISNSIYASTNITAVSNSATYKTTAATLTTYLVRYTSYRQSISYSQRYTYSTCKSTSKVTYWTRVSQYYRQSRTYTAQPIKTYYSYYSSKRWSYYWTSCKKYTVSSYVGQWTSHEKYTQSTTSRTETIHNINV